MSQSIDWSLPQYHFKCNAAFFICNLGSARNRKQMYKNEFAFMLLIIIILQSLIKTFVKFGLLWNFSASCKEYGNCLRCTIAGTIDHYAFLFGMNITLLMILKINEIIFKNDEKFVKKIKFALLIANIIGIAVNEIFLPFKYAVYALEEDDSVNICLPSLNDDTALNFQILTVYGTPIGFGLHVLFYASFVKNVTELYRLQVNKIKTEQNPKKLKQRSDVLKKLMNPAISHSIIVAAILVSWLCFDIIHRAINPSGIPLESVHQFIMGLCVIMMFPFGDYYFNLFCGCFHRVLIQRWLSIEWFELNKHNASSSLDQYKSSDNQTTLEKSSDKLSTIVESKLYENNHKID